MTPVHRIGLVLFPNFSAISLAITCIFELVNWKLGYPAYELTLLSEHGGPIVTSLGNSMETVTFERRVFDTILVGSEYVPSPATPGLLRYLQSASERGTRIASICTGAFVLAQAGLLDGRKATTHWNLTQRLQQLYPEARVVPDRIFTCDGLIWTSVGMSAAFDLAPALVEQ